MRYLITGGAGFIGSHTAVELLQRDDDVCIFDNLSNSGEEVINRIRQITGHTPVFEKGDVRNTGQLVNVFEDFRPDAVIHFAGLKSVGESIEKPIDYYDVNVGGTIALLKVMNHYNVRKLVFSSSATVYTDPHLNLPLTEDSPLGTINPYGASKLMVEDMLRDVAKSNTQWRIALLRYFNPVGAHESGLIGEDPSGIPTNIAPYITGVMKGKYEKVSVFGGDWDTPDGSGVRDYIHVVDLAKGHLAALDWLDHAKVSCDVFNLGTGKGTSVLELINTFAQVSGKSISWEIVDRREGDYGTCYAEPEKANKVLEWWPEYGVEDMCRDAWNWETMNPEGYGDLDLNSWIR